MQLSYFYVFDEASEWDLILIGIGIAAACMWVVCSLIYAWAFFHEYQNSRRAEIEISEDGKEVLPQYKLAKEEEELPESAARTQWTVQHKDQSTKESPASSSADEKPDAEEAKPHTEQEEKNLDV